jgi:hypothetical protein
MALIYFWQHAALPTLLWRACFYVSGASQVTVFEWNV